MRPDEITTQQTPIPSGAEMLRLMGLGVRDALQKHKDQGVPIIVWDRETQQTLEIPADQIDAWIDATERQTKSIEQ